MLAVVVAPLASLLPIGALVLVFAVAFDHESYELGLNVELFATIGLPASIALFGLLEELTRFYEPGTDR